MEKVLSLSPFDLFLVTLISSFRPGYQKIVPGEGMPISKDPNTKGDLIIQFNIEFPNQLNPEQKRMLKDALLFDLES